MPSQWDRLCEILEGAETMPAKHKSEYVAAAVKALAYEVMLLKRSAPINYAFPRIRTSQAVTPTPQG